MNFAAHIAEETAHLERMAAIPGAQGYAKDKAEKMAKWQPAMYAHLPQAVAQAINQQEQTP